MGSDGNSAVKIEWEGGQRLYLYTVKIAIFRQILMSSLNGWVDLSMLNRWLMMTLSSGYLGYMSRIGIPTQIIVDCESDHCLPFLRL